MNLVADAIKAKINEAPVILITHDIELMFKTCNTAYLLSEIENKKISASGNEDRILSFLKNSLKDLIKIKRKGLTRKNL